MIRRLLITLFLFFLSNAFAVVVTTRGVAIPSNVRPTALAAALAHPTAFMNERIVTEGVVKDVCRWAGCWMTIAPGAGRASMRVTFKGFSVPRSIRGHRARIIGRVDVVGNKASFVAEGIEIAESAR